MRQNERTFMKRTCVMIQTITEYAAAAEFVCELVHDECFSTPFCDLASVERTFEKENCVVLGAYQEDRLVGVFSFLVIAEEKYLESMFLYTRQEDACRELMEYLRANYPAFDVWFVLNPKNQIFRGLLEQKKAYFYTEQRYMEYAGERPADIASVIPYEDAYRDAYIALHNSSGYWTGEKMLEALDRFAIFLYVKDSKLAGYVDVSTGDGTNEIFDVLVEPCYRNQGIGKALMSKAIFANGSNRLVLTVDIDNAPAIHVYEQLGFVEIPANNVLTVKWKMG